MNYYMFTDDYAVDYVFDNTINYNLLYYVIIDLPSVDNSFVFMFFTCYMRVL